MVSIWTLRSSPPRLDQPMQSPNSGAQLRGRDSLEPRPMNYVVDALTGEVLLRFGP